MLFAYFSHARACNERATDMQVKKAGRWSVTDRTAQCWHAINVLAADENPTTGRRINYWPKVSRFVSFGFIRAACNAARYSEKNSVCLSVRPSVCHTRDPWQNGREICPDFYTVRKNIYPSFLRRRMVGGGRPLLPEILGQPTPLERNRRFSTNNRS